MVSRLKKDRLKKGNLFVPLIFSFGAALEDLPLDEFLEEPTKISNTLRMIQNYFQVDGVICYADSTALAEALGCGICKDTYPPTVEPREGWQEGFEQRFPELVHVGRVATALEVTKRLNILLPESMLMGVVTGPLTLAGQLSGLTGVELLGRPEMLGLAAKASLTFAKALGDAGIDILIILENAVPPLTEEAARVVGRCYSPIWNTAKFYDLASLLMVEEFHLESTDRLRPLVDGLILPAASGPDLWGKVKRHSFSLPVSLLEREPEDIEFFLKESAIAGSLESAQLFLVTTEREVPRAINKELMIRGIETIRDFLKRSP
jgi:hypothetical protein